MAPISPLNTKRIRVVYNNTLDEHELLFRGPESTSDSQLITAARTVCAAMAGLIPIGGAFLSATYSGRLNPVSIPITWAAIPGTAPQNFSPADAPFFYSFGGRTLAGRRVRWNVFSPIVSRENDWRLEIGDVQAVDNVYNALQSVAGSLAGIDSSVPVIYPYVNVGYNAYWQREARRS